ncbi:amidase [Xylophilus sp. Kf1]|nr:amidase [Xylophilus sp. Kf1]
MNPTHRFIRPQRSAVDIHRAIANRETTAEAVVRQAIDTIEALEPQLHAWKTRGDTPALAAAQALDRRLAGGQGAGPLAGVPLAVKDLLDTADLPTGYGSVVYEGHRPAADAQAVRQVRAADAIVIGKTVTTEFAYFTPGPTANPWHTGHTPGGSSSGSAAAVASGMVPLAFGSQTAGSLIRPASYCGVFALKPTHDLVSGAGVKAFAPSLDTLGWLANSAEDLELMRAALLGESWRTLPDAGGMRLSSCRTHEWSHADASGQQAWDDAHRRLSAAGVPVTDLTLPDALAGLMQAQKTVMAYEACRHLAFEAEHHAGRISQPIRELVALGRTVSDADYQNRLQYASDARTRVLEAMGDADALLVPAAPGEAPAGLSATGDPVFSRVWTLLGFPCVNVPGLLGPSGLPVGMQLVGRPLQERALLAVAARLQTVLAG